MISTYAQAHRPILLLLLTTWHAAIVLQPCTPGWRRTTSIYTHKNHNLRIISQQLVTRKPRAEFHVHQHKKPPWQHTETEIRLRRIIELLELLQLQKKRAEMCLRWFYVNVKYANFPAYVFLGSHLRSEFRLTRILARLNMFTACYC